MYGERMSEGYELGYYAKKCFIEIGKCLEVLKGSKGMKCKYDSKCEGFPGRCSECGNNPKYQGVL